MTPCKHSLRFRTCLKCPLNVSEAHVAAETFRLPKHGRNFFGAMNRDGGYCSQACVAPNKALGNGSCGVVQCYNICIFRQSANLITSSSKVSLSVGTSTCQNKNPQLLATILASNHLLLPSGQILAVVRGIQEWGLGCVHHCQSMSAERSIITSTS